MRKIETHVKCEENENHISYEFERLAVKWADLIGEKKKTKYGDVIIEGKEGDLWLQMLALKYMFDKLAWGDRSIYGKKELDQFISFSEMLCNFLQSIKAFADKNIDNIKSEYSKNWWSRFEFWILKHIMLRPWTIGWFNLVRNTADRTLYEIEQAVLFVREKYEL